MKDESEERLEELMHARSTIPLASPPKQTVLDSEVVRLEDPLVLLKVVLCAVDRKRDIIRLSSS